MDRNREARRAAMVTAANGISRRRHRTTTGSSSLRDSPEDEGIGEMQETGRLRDRQQKKERDRDRERDHRDRDRDRDQDRSGRSKRRRSEKYVSGGGREEGEESSEESVNDEEDEDLDDGPPVRYAVPNPAPMMSSTTSATSLTNQNHHQRKSYPPPLNKVFRPVVPTWKAPDEMIGVSIPRKARSTSTKRSHDTWSFGGVAGGEPIHRQASPSPVRSSVVSAHAAASPSSAPMSPSSSNASLKKKTKPNGQKQRPPKSSSKSSPSIQDEIEIEVAEVLYGLMRQSQPPPAKQELPQSDHMKLEREINRSSGDSRSRVSSPVSNSNSGHPQPTPSVLPQNSSSQATPFTVTAPKRKRPRQVVYQEENQSIFYGQSGLGHVQGRPHLKVEVDNVSNGPSPSLEMNSSENGPVMYDLLNSQVRNESTKPDHSINHRDPKSASGESESRDSVTVKMEDALGSLPVNRLDSSIVKSSLSLGEKENHRLDKLEIDLMAPPPQFRSSSPEREGEGEYGGGGEGQEETEESHKSMVADRVAVGGGSAGGVKYSKTGEVEDDKILDKSVSAGGETNVQIKKLCRIDEAADHQKLSSKSKDRSLDLHLDLEKTVDVEKLNTQQHLKQQQPTPQKSVRDDASADKSGQSSSLQLQMSATAAAAVAAAAAGWPGGIPPMGYVAPLQGVVPMDGSTMAPPVFQPPHFLFSQPRPKRCATHCYVAKNIQCHQQFLKMNSFWPAAAAAAASSTPMFGPRPPYNLNMVPAADLHGNAAGRSANIAQEKGQGQAIAFFPGQPSGSEKVPPAGSGNAADATQKKQFLLPQSLPPGAPANIMHGPFLFPLGQQQAAAAAAAASATARPPGMLTAPAAASAASTSGSASTPVAAATSMAPAVSPAMSFNFPNMPNMPGNETQYLAILGNSAYPFPIPAHVGTPTYGGAHAQAMPFFNGSFYPSQMLHPSQLQAAQQPLQGHQITNVPNAAGSSSHKHMQNLQRPQGASTNGASSNPSPQSFSASKNRATQPPQHEMGGEDSPSTADSRASRQNMGVYGPNFTLPIHPPNFFLSPAALAGSTNAPNTGSTNHGERKQHHLSQQSQALKAGMESMTPPAFAMSFASINGTAPGFDISTMAQSHTILQSLPEGARNYQMMAAAQAAQQKKSYRPADDGKAGGADSSNGDEERKSMAARASASGGHGQSIAFSRSDMPDTSVPTMAGNNVVDSSARSLNLLSSQPRSSRSSGPAAIGNASGPNSQQQQQQMQQQQFQQQQQRLHLQKQHQAAAAAAAATRGKTPTTSNGNAYMDHHLSSSSPMPAKFPSGISGFPPSLVQNSSSPSQSPQWRNSSRPAASQVSSSSIPVSASAAMKNLPQQKSRPQQGHTQISFGTNLKPTAPSQPQQMSSSHQAPSSPMMVGSPSTSSLSKSAGGSPRTTASGSTGNKVSQASSHPAKNSSVVQNQKSSPVGGRNVQSILGSPHISTSTGKPQLQQQQHPQHQLQQPQLSRQAIQQTQLYFSNAYPQPPHNGGTSSATATASGYYLQKHRSEQPQQGQKSHGSGPPTSSGIMSLSPVTLVNTSTTDPAKAVAAAAAAATAAAASSMKMPSPAVLHATQFSGQPPSNMQHQMVPAGFSYVPAAVQVKPAEQKQPAGNDNLHSSWQPEKK